jgi:hypothetical protein
MTEMPGVSLISRWEIWSYPRLLLRLLRDLRSVARQLGTSYLRVLAHVAHFCWRYDLGPREVVFFGLADPDLPREASEGSLGKRGKLALQRRLNPRLWECLVEDKAVFQAFCEHNRIPAPGVYGTLRVRPGEEGRARAGDEWRAILERVPDEFVVKPVQGVYGEGIALYHRQGDGWTDGAGRPLGADEMLTRMLELGKYDSFLAQERIHSHPELAQLSGTSALQTVRLETVVLEDGRVELFAPRLKLIGGDSLVDNYRGGQTGNVTAVVALETGVLGPVYGPSGNGTMPLPVLVHRHPRTGRLLTGFRVPRWDETKRLLRDVAPLFLPLRTLGWDVGISPDGPVIIEANVQADPSHNFPVPEARPGERTLVPTLRRLAAHRPA